MLALVVDFFAHPELSVTMLQCLKPHTQG